ncbi:MAG: epoxyqueuosine reductase QueH [Thermodesulfobacteriota bacterium]|nr:epoxyqueuosine reductase QueH [Thermodesulfobacteriota bacterium]
MKTLLHICCAPCAIYPLEVLRNAEMDVMGFFYRHNIHPYTECMRREQALVAYSESIGLRVIYQQDYAMETFLQNVVFREENRCRYCYHDRIRTAALMARKGKFDYFTTTLLYSKFQNHAQIREIGEAVGRTVGVPFYYHDFREGWTTGIEASKRLNMYRQQYCGCIYSEKERFYKAVKQTSL